MSDVIRMQQEAEARVHAMRERSRRLVERVPTANPPTANPPTAAPPRAEIQAAPDNDLPLLLLLTVLLIRNGAPPELIAMLLYIAL